MDICRVEFPWMVWFFAVIWAVGATHGQAISVRDVGAKGDGRTDDTRGIQEALDRASKARVGVIFPPGRYKISDTLQINVTDIRGEGYPEIVQTRADKDIFFATIWRVTIRGLQFRYGRDQISLGNNNIDQGFMLVSDCRFRDAGGVAVRFRERTNSTFALVEKCAFRQCDQALVAVCDQTHLRNCWITCSAKMEGKAAIENHGVLSCENILGVPLVNGSDQRWIDNYGTLTCRKFRFGGEGGGFTPVVNYAKLRPMGLGPRILIDDCDVCALGNNKRPCAVYCEEIPNQIVISNSGLLGVPGILVRPTLDVKTYFDGVRPGMLRYALQNNTGEFAGKIPQAMIDASKNRKKETSYTNQLSPSETRKALRQAGEIAKNIPSPAPGKAVVGGKTVHRQQTNPKKFVDLTPENLVWDADDFMDGTSERNSAYLAVAQAGDDVIILRRMDHGKNGDWPHIRIRNVKVDLDRFPYLSWRLKDNGLDPAGYAVKVIDNETKTCIRLVERHGKPFFTYQAYDLRNRFGYTGGVHSFDIKFYFLGICFHSATELVKAKKGDFIVLDFLRLEAP